MLDIKYIRDNKEEAIKKLSKRNINSHTIDEIILLDEKWRKHTKKLEEIKAKKNQFNKTIVKLKNEEKTEKIQEMTDLTKQEQKVEDELVPIVETYDKLIGNLPNYPHDDVPLGKDEKDNQVIKEIGKKPKFSFQPKSYIELYKIHDLIDTDRAAKVSGTRFGYLKNEGALLWNALVQYTLGIIIKEKFVPFYSPVLVKKEAMENSGYDSYLDGQEAYYIEKDNLFLVGTGEHALLPYHSDEILDAADLPMYYTTYSSCFRREAGSYGKDTKGILRVHQFDKQELVIISTPENSWNEFDHLIAIQEKIIRGLKLPYHLLNVCTGDLPKPSAKVVDLECWIPSENKYRETHSASNCTDYQARRNNIRFRDKDNKNRIVHVLNATGITARTLISILENYQQKDGSIKIPRVLTKYMNGISEIKVKK